MAVLFALALFWSAALLFCVQPMVGKMLLPHLGGAPSVWNTCMVFFQAMLLAGYAFAHWMATRLRKSHQVVLHAVILLFAFTTLPLALNTSAAEAGRSEIPPAFWLLKTLTMAVGPSFFALALTTPLLQRWFAESSHVSARDPYFLYAASNLGSFVALLGYPFLLEPNWRLADQAGFWKLAFLILPVLCLACVLGRFAFRPAVPGSPDVPSAKISGAPKPPWIRKLYWVACAAVPSALLLGFTTYLATEVASVPLLWVIPLAIYLLTFVFVFARHQIFSQSLLSRALPIGAVAVTFLLCARFTEPTWLVMGLPLGVFFLATMVCHGRLAATRPAPEHLTEFYLWISVGGVLGGMFSALLAPSIFRDIVEFRIALVLACWILPFVSRRKSDEHDPQPAHSFRPRRFLPDVSIALIIGSVTALLAILIPRTGLSHGQVQAALVFGIPLLGCYLLGKNSFRFALTLGAIMIGGVYFNGTMGRTLHVERNFFGVSRITLSPDGQVRHFVHGRTLHGSQWIDPDRAGQPLAFYHRNGPVGDIFIAFRRSESRRRVGIVGLGAGSMAAYAQSDEKWTFFDIDPTVLRIARDTNYFTFLASSSASRLCLVEGDARLRLSRVRHGEYGLLVVDAFSSDAIPVHLITREAVKLYVDRIDRRGLLVFHISNRYLNLEPVLGNIAHDLGLASRTFNDCSSDPTEGRERSQWVVMGRQSRDLAAFNTFLRWQPLEVDPAIGVWSDDFSSPLSIFTW